MLWLAALAVLLALWLVLVELEAAEAKPELVLLAVEDEVALVVVVVEAELLAGTELPVEDEAALLAVVANVDAVEAQDTVLGTLTWLAWQICWAKSMAFCWSEASHSWIRQHEMAPMKLLSAQMQAGSRPQLPMPPLRKMSAQVVFEGLAGADGTAVCTDVRERKTYGAGGEALELGAGDAGQREKGRESEALHGCFVVRSERVLIGVRL